MQRRRTPNWASIWNFLDQVQVVCARCGGRAVARCEGMDGRARIACSGCGAARDCRWAGMAGWCFGRRPEDVGDGFWLLGAPYDPWFRQPLWLQTACVGETLWAYNADHLRFLMDLVAADLRTRSVVVDGGPRNRLLESRLPKWMLSRKNRAAVLRGLDAIAVRLVG